MACRKTSEYHPGHGRRMSKARLVITAVVVEGRSQGEVARAYGVSQGAWPIMTQLSDQLGSLSQS
jgi:hypothetical protein